MRSAFAFAALLAAVNAYDFFAPGSRSGSSGPSRGPSYRPSGPTRMGSFGSGSSGPHGPSGPPSNYNYGQQSQSYDPPTSDPWAPAPSTPSHSHAPAHDPWAPAPSPSHAPAHDPWAPAPSAPSHSHAPAHDPWNPNPSSDTPPIPAPPAHEHQQHYDPWNPHGAPAPTNDPPAHDPWAPAPSAPSHEHEHQQHYDPWNPHGAPAPTNDPPAHDPWAPAPETPSHEHEQSHSYDPWNPHGNGHGVAPVAPENSHQHPGPWGPINPDPHHGYHHGGPPDLYQLAHDIAVLKSSALIEDFFETNEDQIVIQGQTMTNLLGPFCVEAGTVLDISATFTFLHSGNPMLMVSIVGDDLMPLAQSQADPTKCNPAIDQMACDGDKPVNMSIEWRGKIEEETSIMVVVTSAGTVMIPPKHLQAGYKLYGEHYPLIDTLDTSCVAPM